jgi:hypothetical protein
MAAKTAGYSFTEIICRIVEVARERYRSEGASQMMGLPATIAADPRLADSPIHREAERSPNSVPAAECAAT